MSIACDICEQWYDTPYARMANQNEPDQVRRQRDDVAIFKEADYYPDPEVTILSHVTCYPEVAILLNVTQGSHFGTCGPEVAILSHVTLR